MNHRAVGEQTVPDALIGCWRRNWIRFGDAGPHETDVAVVWLQTASGMGDLRIDPKQALTDTDWLDGATGFSQQATPSFPEKGWLDWRSDTLVYEIAPSGAYVEEWERLPGSGPLVEHYVALDTPTVTNLYVAGDHHFLAVARPPGEQIHEFSYGRSPSKIALSTLPGRVGEPMRLDHDWSLVSRFITEPLDNI